MKLFSTIFVLATTLFLHPIVITAEYSSNGGIQISGYNSFYMDEVDHTDATETSSTTTEYYDDDEVKKVWNNAKRVTERDDDDDDDFVEDIKSEEMERIKVVWNKAMWFIFSFVAFILLVAKCSKHIRFEWDDGDDEYDDEEDDIESNNRSRTPEPTQEERLRLYSKAFDRNQNQIVVDASHIIKMQDVGLDDRDDSTTDDDDDDQSIHLALEDARSHLRRTSGRSISMASSGGRRRSSLIHPRSSLAIEGGGGDDDQELESGGTADSQSSQTTTVRGHCIICFEDIKAGETIVWSETKSCPHVYHKDCLVSYLAHRKHTKIGDENPCPSCRQPFVTVCTPCDDVTECSTRASESGSQSSDYAQ